MFTFPRTTTALAITGGLLWTIKVGVITARDASFDPLESWVFIGGLLAILTAAVFVAMHLTRALRGIARAAGALGATIALIGATLALEAIGAAVVGGLHGGGNLGLENEGGILFAGLAWLALGATAAIRTRTHPTPAAAARRVPAS